MSSLKSDRHVELSSSNHTITHWLIACCFVTALLLTNSSTNATVIGEPSSTAAARQEALQAVPFDQLSEQVREGIRDVVEQSSFYRRLPTKQIQCDPDMYLFLLRNPDVVVNIWDIMGASDLQLTRTDALTFAANDGAGTTSSLKLVYGSPHIHLLYADSVYDGPLMGRSVKTRTVLLVRTSYERGHGGLPMATSTMDVFVRIDHVAAKIVARTMAPLVSQTADHNFVETIGFFQRLSKTAAENSHGMQRMAAQLEKVHPTVQQQFASISAMVAQRAEVRAQQTTTNHHSETEPTNNQSAANSARTPTPTRPAGFGTSLIRTQPAQWQAPAIETSTASATVTEQRNLPRKALTLRR